MLVFRLVVKNSVIISNENILILTEFLIRHNLRYSLENSKIYTVQGLFYLLNYL